MVRLETLQAPTILFFAFSGRYGLIYVGGFSTSALTPVMAGGGARKMCGSSSVRTMHLRGFKLVCGPYD